MFIKKTSIFLALLFSINACINGYDVTSFFPFGKAARAITAAIKQLTAKKVTLLDAINEHFDKQEKEIINKIKVKYGISDATWKAHEQLYNQIVAKDPLYKPLTGKLTQSPSENPILKTAREVLINFGMNPEAVPILNSSVLGTAGVLTDLSLNNTPSHVLHLHISELEILTQQEYTAILKHEIMHLWYADSLKLKLLYKFFPLYFNDPLIDDYRKNFELRADIIASIHDNKDARGLSSWFAKNSIFDSYSIDNTHPKFSERVQALKQHLAYQQEEKKYKKA